MADTIQYEGRTFDEWLQYRREARQVLVSDPEAGSPYIGAVVEYLFAHQGLLTAAVLEENRIISDLIDSFRVLVNSFNELAKSRNLPTVDPGMQGRVSYLHKKVDGLAEEVADHALLIRGLQFGDTKTPD